MTEIRRITLARNAYSPSMGTFGELVVEGETFFTVERPWMDNEPFVSCIPEGVYQVETLPTSTPVPPEFNDRTWYLHGGSVGVNIGQRTRIAIHVANVAKDVAGCIGVGMSLSCVRGQWAVMESTRALSRLHQLLPDSFDLEIVRGEGCS